MNAPKAAHRPRIHGERKGVLVMLTPDLLAKIDSLKGAASRRDWIVAACETFAARSSSMSPRERETIVAVKSAGAAASVQIGPTRAAPGDRLKKAKGAK